MKRLILLALLAVTLCGCPERADYYNSWIDWQLNNVVRLQMRITELESITPLTDAQIVELGTARQKLQTIQDTFENTAKKMFLEGLQITTPDGTVQAKFVPGAAYQYQVFVQWGPPVTTLATPSVRDGLPTQTGAAP